MTRFFLAAVICSTANAAMQYVNITDASALCLDGSRYAFFLCTGTNATSFSIDIQGGGWCYDENDCLGRSTTSLGTSKNWSAVAKTLRCTHKNAFTEVVMYYCDGASFTGNRVDPVPVPGTSKSVHYRGARNLDATLDELFAHHGLKNATQVIVTGGSAGGLSTFLHLDHVAERVRVYAPLAKVVGKPVCGFFLDHGNDGFDKPNVTYPLRMQYVYGMQNSSGSLSPVCQQALSPDSWRCIMAPYAARFIQNPWFAQQSRFDHWQLTNEEMLPCMKAQAGAPPFKPSSCTADEIAAIHAYGPSFMDQFSPLITGTQNGAFIDACIIHGSTNSSINGKTNNQAFDAWLAGTGPQWYIMQCNGSNSTGPCDPSPICAPF